MHGLASPGSSADAVLVAPPSFHLAAKISHANMVLIAAHLMLAAVAVLVGCANVISFFLLAKWLR